MRRRLRPAVLILLLGPALLAAQEASPPLDDAAIEAFMRDARVVRTRGVPKGVTRSIRATLSNGTLSHDVHVQTIDESKREFTSMRGTEFNFRDSWRFNVAAYRIDRLLGLHLVPVSIERRFDGKPAAFTWWGDDVLMDEGERLKSKRRAPDANCWNAQMRLVRMFDQLIDNIDRNLGNVLITTSWRIWAIDHTRAFRFSSTPRRPDNISHIDAGVLERLRALDDRVLREAVRGYLTADDVRMILRRRDAIVAHFDKAGADAIYDRRQVCQ